MMMIKRMTKKMMTIKILLLCRNVVASQPPSVKHVLKLSSNEDPRTFEISGSSVVIFFSNRELASVVHS